ncbi:MAG: DUF3365 domain-containing protein [Deltaproteobacteria bacterium]|nr:DUF3365 domain-containing protein [Deltaproteobacteria bacterium]
MVNPEEERRYQVVSLVRVFVLLLLFWTLLLAGSLFFNLRQTEKTMFALAEIEAQTHFNKDTVYRRWAAMQGGVYVPISALTPPNPGLSHIKERDIVTASGRRLTLVNPAYMTRQVHELGAEQYGVRGHITSLKPVRPETEPDEWEIKALLDFEKGVQEVKSLEMIDGKPFLRFMRPFIAESGCLKCHAYQGYTQGDVRGGVSVSVPMENYYELRDNQARNLILWHLLIYLAGVFSLFTGFRILRRKSQDNQAAWQAVALDRDRFASLLELSRMGDKSEEQLIRFSLEEYVRLTRSRIGYFHFYDESTQMVELYAWSRGAMDICTVSGVNDHFPLAETGIWADCIRERGPVIHNNYESLPNRKGIFQGHFPISRHLSVPVMDAESIVAIAGVGNKAKPYDENDVTQLTLFANTMWEIVKNIRAYRELAEQERELKKHRDNLEVIVAERTEKLARRTQDLEISQNTLQALLADVSQAKLQLETANVKLQELDRLKSMFIASMSHELRTPLNSIIGFTSLILGDMVGSVNEEQRDMLGRVLRSGKHLLSLITDVIDIAKIESGKITPYPESFMLSDLVHEAVLQVEGAAAEKGLALEQCLPEKPINMHTDRRRLLQCLLNYLSNALKFSEKGTVTIAVAEGSGRDVGEGGQKIAPGDWIEISVADTGIGISQADVKLLFGSFVRLDTPLKATVQGTGLGLYLTRKLATEVLGGEVGVESEAGRGSRFWIRLPSVLQVVT